ncbi:hypothetical protein BU23DRAFT_71296 [Bimuria novae-zelandiae CBS 107.79]|uniref:Secreted protein n=1 Tax=Bimuria novae-zelandiae CBS 107.79 TaxID=1447943 RepID=A0A6A5UMR1_9PLEO|nr:hypothetical protein BU23DRAFT_71296 [Bimuria novae-zelandiae CBS 107.79]
MRPWRVVLVGAAGAALYPFAVEGRGTQCGQWMEWIVNPIQRHTTQGYSVQSVLPQPQRSKRDWIWIGQNTPRLCGVGLS